MLTTHWSIQIDRLLLGPKLFPIDRMLAIFFHIIDEPIESVVDVYTEVDSMNVTVFTRISRFPHSSPCAFFQNPIRCIWMMLQSTSAIYTLTRSNPLRVNFISTSQSTCTTRINRIGCSVSVYYFNDCNWVVVLESWEMQNFYWVVVSPTNMLRCDNLNKHRK